MKQFPAILILVLIFFSPAILFAQGKTIEIKIVDKRFVPPARTPKIPQEFKDKGARFVVRAGDVIKICNADKFFSKPFSLSAENRFQGVLGDGGLRPGNCITITAKNAGDKCIQFWLADEVHSRTKLFMVVPPTNWPNEGEENTPPGKQYLNPGQEYAMDEEGNVLSDEVPTDISGSWKYSTDWVYTITQKDTTFSWDMAKFNEKGKGKISGNSISANWSGTNGSGSATGTVNFDSNGKTIEIAWSNGVVFKRN